MRNSFENLELIALGIYTLAAIVYWLIEIDRNHSKLLLGVVVPPIAIGSFYFFNSWSYNLIAILLWVLGAIIGLYLNFRFSKTQKEIAEFEGNMNLQD